MKKREEKRGDFWFGMIIWRHSFSFHFFFTFFLVEEGMDRVMILG